MEKTINTEYFSIGTIKQQRHSIAYKNELGLLVFDRLMLDIFGNDKGKNYSSEKNKKEAIEFIESEEFIFFIKFYELNYSIDYIRRLVKWKIKRDSEV